MSARDDSKPIANTQQFRAFTEREVEQPQRRSGRNIPLLVGLLVVLVAAVVIIAVAAL